MVWRKIPNADIWIVYVKKELFKNDDFKRELDMLLSEQRWKNTDAKKDGFWDIQ